MSLEVHGETDVGLKREKNEDSFLVDENVSLFLVADGMGGHKGGDIASRLAVETMNEVVHEHLNHSKLFTPKSVIEEGYRQSNEKIYLKSRSESGLQGMGTTMVTMFIHEETVYIGNVGDSRAYLIRGDSIWQITEDHSLLNEHLKAGLLRDVDVPNFQAKNVITRSVGFEKAVRCDVYQRKKVVGDRYLICSDGLSGLVTDQDILQICQGASAEAAVAQCISSAKDGGGDDNITALIVDIR